MDTPIKSLPLATIDIYKEYKRRQKIVLEWLRQHCQGQQDHVTTQTSLTEFERLVDEVLVQRIEIPNDIYYSARTMLQMRKEVRRQYEDSDGGHDSCIMIFSRIVRKLARLPRNPSTQLTTTDVVNSSPKNFEAYNRFAVLPSVNLQGLGKNYTPFANDAFGPANTCVVNHFADVVGSEATNPTLPEPESIFQPHLSTQILLLFQFSMLLFQARSACAKARTGEVPLYIAAYLVERAILMNKSNMVGVWLSTCGYETAYSALDDVECRLRTAFQSCNEEMSEAFRHKFGALDIDRQVITPFKHLDTIPSVSERFSSLGDPKEAYTCYMKTKAPYKKVVSDLERDGLTESCSLDFVTDLVIGRAVQRTALDLKVPYSSGSQVIRLVQSMVDDGSMPDRLFSASSLQMLVESALSFENGHVTVPGSSENDLGPAPNCRLRALVFAQEVERAVTQYMPPKDPMLVGFSTYQNLEVFRGRLQLFLKTKHFDLISQHPAIAGSDILLILDTIYRFGFQQLTFGTTFLGPLHVYNALRSVGALSQIDILENFRNQFKDAAFYGSLPTKKFIKAWHLFDDPFNCSQSSHVEAKFLLSFKLSGQFPKYTDEDKELETSERGQVYVTESRYGYNKRMKASDYSLLHRIYNQKNDIADPISDSTRCELFGVEEADNWREKLDLTPSPKANEQTQEEVQKMQEREKSRADSPVFELEFLETALCEEMQKPFPLMKFNLMRVWHQSYAVMKRVYASRPAGQNKKSSNCIDSVLKECDAIYKEKTRGVSGRMLSGDEIEGWEHVQAWKTAFVEEFGGTTLADYKWKNL